MTSDKNQRLLQRLLETFKLEARERITALAQGLGQMASAEGEIAPMQVEEAFREAHSLKAAAHSVSQKEIGLLCQSIESVFAAVKRKDVQPSRVLVVEMQTAVDAMEDFLAAIDGAPVPGQAARAAELSKSLTGLLDHAKAGARAAPAPKVEPPAPPKPVPAAPAPAVEKPSPALARPAPDPRSAEPASVPEPMPAEPARADLVATHVASTAETVRLSSQQLDSLLRQTDEMLLEKLASRQVVSAVDEAVEAIAEWQKEWSSARAGVARLRTQPDPLRQNAPLLKFLEGNEARIGALATKLVGLRDRADSEARRLETKVDQLRWEMKEILTVPFASQMPLFQRAVRDLARDQGKDVELVSNGGDIEIDRRILQELKDPLLHLVRNCVDHGVERPDARLAAGKPARATVTLAVSIRDSDRAEFTIADDGGGVATARLAAAAARLGVATAKDADQAELMRLIFVSGVSTSPMITDVSGRGLGMAIVLEKVERLGGRIGVESEPGKGTTFRLVVPLSLATYRGISVRVSDRLFVFPSLGVDKVVRARRDALSTVESRPVLSIGGTAIPIVRLSDALEMRSPPSRSDGGAFEAVIIGAAGRQVAFEVDSVEDDREILVKSLGRCLIRVRNVQGATILATGTIAPILNIHDLMKSAIKVGSTVRTEDEPAEAESAEMASILVVEDSITARGLLRSILESAGYRVQTAVDGMEAWSALNLGSFDLVVSDVEMPRMNGFDLTARIRADKRLGELPVVLVTALESREDRERGVEVGANAYILKGSFEQNVLLEAVRRLT